MMVCGVGCLFILVGVSLWAIFPKEDSDGSYPPGGMKDFFRTLLEGGPLRDLAPGLAREVYPVLSLLCLIFGSLLLAYALIAFLSRIARWGIPFPLG